MESKDTTKEMGATGMVMVKADIVTGMVCAIKATNRKVLVDTINQFTNSDDFKGKDGSVYLRAELSGEQLGCEGSSVDYATEADVPYKSVPCPCGNPNHWLIKYDEE